MVAVEIERTVPTLTVTSCAWAAPTPATTARQASKVRWNVIRFSPCARVGGALSLSEIALFGLEEIASLAIAIEAILTQGIERPHDLAAVAAANRRHQLLEIFWAVAQRCLDRGKALAGKARRFRHPRLQPRARSKRPSQVEAGLGAGAGAGRERGIERQRTHAFHDHQVAIRLEAGAERPVHLLVGEDVD